MLEQQDSRSFSSSSIKEKRSPIWSNCIIVKNAGDLIDHRPVGPPRASVKLCMTEIGIQLNRIRIRSEQ